MCCYVNIHTHISKYGDSETIYASFGRQPQHAGSFVKNHSKVWLGSKHAAAEAVPD